MQRTLTITSFPKYTPEGNIFCKLCCDELWKEGPVVMFAIERSSRCVAFHKECLAHGCEKMSCGKRFLSTQKFRDICTSNFGDDCAEDLDIEKIMLNMFPDGSILEREKRDTFESDALNRILTAVDKRLASMEERLVSMIATGSPNLYIAKSCANSEASRGQGTISIEGPLFPVK